MVTDQHAAGQLRDGRLHAHGQAANGQQQLVLLRLQAVRAGLLLAEMEEAADLETELGEGTVAMGGEVFSAHINIVSRYKWSGRVGWFRRAAGRGRARARRVVPARGGARTG